MKFGKIAVSLMTWILGVALLVTIVAYLAGVFRVKVEPGKLAEPASGAPKCAKIEVARVDDEALLEKAPGTLSALHESMISPRITARIEEIDARAGDAVKAGQMLARLDARDLAAREAQASQSVAAAEARLIETQKDHERMQKLVSAGAVSRSVMDSAQAAFDTAQANVARAKQAANEAGTGRAWATIEAPFDGRVVDRYAEPGDTAMPGQPIMKIYDPSQMRLETYVRESLATTLRPGMKLAVQIDALGANVDGTIQEIVPQSDPGSRSMLVKVALPQRNDLFPGMFGRLLIPAGRVRRLYVPEAAIQQDGQLTFAWVVGQNGRAERRLVKLGEEKKSGWVEVISGIDPGEHIGVF